MTKRREFWITNTGKGVFDGIAGVYEDGNGRDCQMIRANHGVLIHVREVVEGDEDRVQYAIETLQSLRNMIACPKQRNLIDGALDNLIVPARLEQKDEK